MLQTIRRRARWVPAVALAAALAGSEAALAHPAPQNGNPTFVRTKVDAPLRNLGDRQGMAVTQTEAGTLLRVHGKSQGTYPFYEVSVAGGMPTWVFGQYLEQTDAEKVLRVNANHVNQRPQPSTGLNSMPLGSRLMAGDRVLMIQRDDETKTWNQDWIQVWSPADTRAWVEASMTEPVTDITAAQAEWKAGLRSLPKATAKKAAAKPQNAGAGQETNSAPAKPVRPEAIRSLRYSDSLFAQAIADKNVSLLQLQKVEDAYHKVLEMAPAGTTVREMALQQLEKLKVHKNMAELREQMRADEAAKAQRMLEIQEEQRRQDLKRTATWGRFHARGWVESERKPGGEVQYFVRWDGGRQAELVCGSGRYDLSFFEGFQIGVQGSTRRAAAPATIEAAETLRLIDVSRIEVIAGSASLR